MPAVEARWFCARRGLQTEFVVELGESLYEVERPWSVLPPGLELAYVSTIAVDAEGCIYAASAQIPRLPCSIRQAGTCARGARM